MTEAFISLLTNLAARLDQIAKKKVIRIRKLFNGYNMLLFGLEVKAEIWMIFS